MLRLTPTPYEIHPTLPLATDVPVAQGRIKKGKPFRRGECLKTITTNHTLPPPTGGSPMAQDRTVPCVHQQ